MRRKNILVLMISLSLVLLLGSSYAILRSTVVGNNSYVINVGTLEVTFVDSKTEFLNLTNMYPMSDKEGSSQDKELSFMVRNTGNVDSYYDVTLEETSTNPEFKSVIRYIINKDDKGYSEPKTLGEDKFIEVGGYLKPNESSSYKVKVWLDYNADNTYMNKEFKAKVVVNAFQESEYAKDVIKNQLVKYSESSKEDFTGGLVAVSTDGELYNETDETQTIREYRYSGPNVNNYVTFNDELWRIIGVFKDENGEHLKIVRDNALTTDMFPETYTINETNYIVKADTVNYAYWNNKVEGNINSDWATAGLQYFLNTEHDDNMINGYLSFLKEEARKMIEETTYYFGAVTFTYKVTIDTLKEAYINERKVGGCEGGIGPDSNNLKSTIESNDMCRVWAGHKAIWTGKVGLLYLSDYGFSIANTYWNDNLLELGLEKSWINATHGWLLTPFTYSSYAIAEMLSNRISFRDTNRDGEFVLPTIYLKSNVKITSGTGEEKNPYILSEN